jgi:hypothetical protein
VDNLPYDIVIGIHTIRKYSLTKVFESIFVYKTNIDMLGDVQLPFNQSITEGLEQHRNTLNTIVHKSVLLEVEDDNDFVDDFLQEEDQIMDSIASGNTTPPEQHSSTKIFGSEWLQKTIRQDILSEYSDCLSAVLSREPARVAPF